MRNKLKIVAVFFVGIYFFSFVFLAIGTKMMFGGFSATSFAADFAGIIAAFYMLALLLVKTPQPYSRLGVVPLIIGLSKVITILPGIIGIGIQNAGRAAYILWGVELLQAALYLGIAFLCFFEILLPKAMAFAYAVPVAIALISNREAFTCLSLKRTGVPYHSLFLNAFNLFRLKNAFFMAALILLTLSSAFIFKNNMRAEEGKGQWFGQKVSPQLRSLYGRLMTTNVISLILFAAFVVAIMFQESDSKIIISVGFLLLLAGEAYLFWRSAGILKEAYTAGDLLWHILGMVLHHLSMGAILFISGRQGLDSLGVMVVYGLSVIPALVLGGIVFANLCFKFDKITTRRWIVAGVMLFHIGMLICMSVVVQGNWEYMLPYGISQGWFVPVYIFRGVALSRMIWYANPNDVSPYEKQ